MGTRQAHSMIVGHNLGMRTCLACSLLQRPCMPCQVGVQEWPLHGCACAWGLVNAGSYQGDGPKCCCMPSDPKSPICDVDSPLPVKLSPQGRPEGAGRAQ
eukprot:1138964-Pelagomonas_calceolata.AAC.3